MTSRLPRLGDRVRRGPPLYIGGASAALVILVAALVLVTGGPSTRTIRAQFAAAPGLFKGNNVDILGIKVGSVTGVAPGPDFVMVTMKIDRSIKVPAGATAVIMAPQVVSDRFVELGPSYSSGPVLTADATIPLARTAVPQSVDAVIAALDDLARQLGPNGANKNGALTDLVHQLALQFGGSGPDLHNSVVNFSQALNALSDQAPALGGTLTNLGDLSKALADNSGAYRSFAGNLASVSQILAQDRQDISAVLSSLQQLFANLTTFLQADGTNLGTSFQNLAVFAKSLQSQQAALAQAYDLAPLALQNLDQAIDKNAPGGAAIRGRYDPVASTNGLFQAVCGSPALRFLVILATGTQTNPLTPATPVDTVCGIGNALTALTPPPGASPGPDLSLKALVP